MRVHELLTDLLGFFSVLALLAVEKETDKLTACDGVLVDLVRRNEYTYFAICSTFFNKPKGLEKIDDLLE